MKAFIGHAPRLARAVLLALLIVPLLIAPAVASSEAGDAAAPSAAAQQAIPAPAAPAYRISPGDVLSITVLGVEEFSGQYPVNSAGTISYPHLNDVPARGLTCSEFEKQLAERLSEFVKKPVVMVTVREYGPQGMSIFVLGEVKNPGMYPLAPGTGLLGALAAAGGVTDLASGVVTVAKARTGEIHTYGLEQALAGALASAEAVVEPGDVVVVGRSEEADASRRYSVLGEVPNPGRYDIPFRKEVQVLDAMEEAGLLEKSSSSERPGAPISLQDRFPTADFENALLQRDEVVVPLNLSALLQGDTGQDILLMPGDVLTIPRRSLVSVYVVGEVALVGRQLLPTGQRVLDLLNAAGGVRPGADLGGAKVMRPVGVEGEVTSISVDIARLLNSGDAEQNLVLQDRDVLVVPPRGQPNDFWRYLPSVIPYLLYY